MRLLLSAATLSLVCALGCSRRSAEPAGDESVRLVPVPAPVAAGAGNPTPAKASSPPTPAGDDQGRCLSAEATSKYNVLFPTSAARAKAVLVGWREPGAPRMTVQRNPFTKKDMNVRTTEPPQGPAGPEGAAWDLRPDDIPPDAGYAGYLESRVPPQLRALPHRALKRVYFELAALAKMLTGKDEIPEALYPPSGCTTSLPLLRMPDAVTATLRGLTDDGATKLAARVVADKSDELAFLDWSPEDVAAFLRDLRDLLRPAQAGDGLYLLPV